MFAEKENIKNTNTNQPGQGSSFFQPVVQRAPQGKDLPGDVPETPAGQFVTPDSRGIGHNNDTKISLDIHIDFLPQHTRLHVFISNEAGGDYKQGMPLKIIGNPGKGGDFTVTLSPVPDHFYIRFEARSETTNINVPRIMGSYSLNLD
ncbi:MAG TPA: hypothetical protein VFE53_03835 [Mucilaginibacter sp.]|jgi:hypothetical protein|nr:hypothetical protein [Mucilaginibacter sp.]